MPAGPAQLGVVYPAGSVHQLADAVSRLRQDPTTRVRLSAEGRKAMVERHDWRHVLDHVLHLAGVGHVPSQLLSRRRRPDSGRRDDDVPLVEDPDLPGAGLLLSRANLEAWLTESLGRPCAVELRRLRYKPGTSVVLGFDLITAARLDDVAVTEPCVAWAYADHAAAKIAKTLERIPAEACLAHDPAAHVLVATAAGDRALPLLPRLGEADATARFLDRLLPDAPDPGRARIRTVRHNPGRRWVGVLERDAEPDLLLRAYSSTARMVRAAGCYKTLGRTEVPTPRPIGKSRSLAALAVSWTEGDTLELAGGEDRWRAAGTQPGPPARQHPREAADPRARRTTSAAVAAGRRADRAPPPGARRRGPGPSPAPRSGCWTSRPGDVVPLHGDFSADQVVVGPDGVPVLIDLDSAHLGSAATDLGCLVASTLTEAEALGMAPQGERDVAALLAGYLGVRRPPDRFAVDVHAIAFRLRKAADPFRTCAPDWAEQVTRRVDRTRAALDALVTVGLPR